MRKNKMIYTDKFFKTYKKMYKKKMKNRSPIIGHTDFTGTTLFIVNGRIVEKEFCNAQNKG